MASDTRVLYDQNDAEIRRDVSTTNEFRAVITRDSIVYCRLVDARRMLAYGYARPSRDLTLNNGTVPHIEGLTKSRMVWTHSRSIGVNRADFTMVFAR